MIGRWIIFYLIWKKTSEAARQYNFNSQFSWSPVAKCVVEVRSDDVVHVVVSILGLWLVFLVEGVVVLHLEWNLGCGLVWEKDFLVRLGILPLRMVGLVSPVGGSCPLHLLFFLARDHYPHFILTDHWSWFPKAPIHSHLLPLAQHHPDLASTAHQVVYSVV